MRHIFVQILFIMFLSNNSYAEMNSSKILNNIFNGCIGKSKQIESLKYIYCGCYTTKIAQKFTLDEFIKMSVNASHLNKSQMQKEFIKNPKIMFSIKECIDYL